jgi:sterol desaturase/sphingolipid hydroxylase (fatty acid hydroxylase superfamily)
VPTPLELLQDSVVLAIFVLYAALLAWETLAPAQAGPRVAGWRLRGVSALIVYVFVSSYLPLWIVTHVGAFTWLDASWLGTLGGALVALLAYELLLYGWHRAMHRSDLLFRIFHQVHHSAERLDVSGAFWFSPLDMTGFTLVSVASLTIVGITAEAAAAFALITTLLSIFQHANVRTPRWLGYFVQRPESHSHHHARGVHRDNYADLPLFDLLFGTFCNPVGFAAEHGYYDGASGRLLEMLALRDVSAPSERAQSTPQNAELSSILRGRELHGTPK